MRFVTLIPEIWCSAKHLERRMLRASMISKKRYGESGHPCLRPLSLLKKLVGSPLIRTAILALVTQERVQVIKESPKPTAWRMSLKKSQSTQSDDLLQMVEDSRITGKIAGGINSTFLVLIPKDGSLVSFNDYRPISLCNLIYKIISRVISNRIKPLLEKSLSAEQSGFLKGKRIQDAIGAAHECLHSIKQKNQKALVIVSLTQASF
jgi:hypothetical protein